MKKKYSSEQMQKDLDDLVNGATKDGASQMLKLLLRTSKEELKNQKAGHFLDTKTIKTIQRHVLMLADVGLEALK